MKKILLGAAALSMLAAPAFAQSSNGLATQTASVNLSANVQPLCGLSTTGSQSVNVNQLNGGSIVDNNGYLKPETTTPVSITAFAGAPLTGWCNGLASEVKLTAGAMYGPADDLHADFDQYINIALENWKIDGKVIGNAINVDGQGASVTAPTGVFNGAFDGTIRFVNTGRRPVAGNYVGSISLTITAKS